jgi:hypothetical protein
LGVQPLAWSLHVKAARSRPARASSAARIEQGEGTAQGHVSTISRIQEALERAGIHFLEEDGGVYGVKLAPKAKSKRRVAGKG